MESVTFYHGALADSYETQANKQGYTFGDDSKWVQDVAYGIVCAHIHGCITDREYSNILSKFQKKILIRRLKPLHKNEK